ncbi:uncharacterized protein At3g28850-like [Coffea eugenioides]|uniref:uncharacterized protein At3g28850-like n=1 Tax=Coffea eugenioides TaxID=49369 RepID=UPI000F60DBF5|nr:uncharacterized protein At3g28850-like [Coffea eugenioides]
MGCISSTLLTHDDPDFSQIGGSSSAFAHHIVKLTSTTYGLLTLDPPPPPSSDLASPAGTIVPPTPPPGFTLSLTSLSSDLRSPLKPDDDIINSWELMAGLDSTPPPHHPSFRFSPTPSISTSTTKENSNPNLPSCFTQSNQIPTSHDPRDAVLAPSRSCSSSSLSLDEFEKLCPPNGESKVVIYTTTLRGIRKTFEACNAVRSAIQGYGVLICERDVSMDRGFRDELRELMLMIKPRPCHSGNSSLMIPPRVFIKGRYIGGVEEVMRIAEDGALGGLLAGLPKLRLGHNNVCDGCGGARFLPCFQCNGSCKMVSPMEDEMDQTHNSLERTVVVRCSHCNENGLVLCPICT